MSCLVIMAMTWQSKSLRVKPSRPMKAWRWWQRSRLRWRKTRSRQHRTNCRSVAGWFHEINIIIPTQENAATVSARAVSDESGDSLTFHSLVRFIRRAIKGVRYALSSLLRLRLLLLPPLLPLLRCPTGLRSLTAVGKLPSTMAPRTARRAVLRSGNALARSRQHHPRRPTAHTCISMKTTSYES